jgi:hypothetical protein
LTRKKLSHVAGGPGSGSTPGRNAGASAGALIEVATTVSEVALASLQGVTTPARASPGRSVGAAKPLPPPQVKGT